MGVPQKGYCPYPKIYTKYISHVIYKFVGATPREQKSIDFSLILSAFRRHKILFYFVYYVVIATYINEYIKR